jgi:hypothetical protein
VVKDPSNQKAMGGKVESVFVDKKTLQVCVHCAGKAHGKTYTRTDGKGRPSVTSEWTRLKAKSRGMALAPSKQKTQAMLHDRKVGKDDNEPSAWEVYQASKNADLRRATDWCTELGGGAEPFMWLKYGCCVCRYWTVNSRSWYRCQRRVRVMLGDASSQGRDQGHWRCGTCFGQWNWTLCGPMRMLVVGKADAESGFSKDYMYSYIGECDATVDNKVNFLKTATLLSAIGGQPVTQEAILGALALVETKVMAKFSKGHMREVKWVRSMCVAKEKLDERNIDIVCDSPQLCLKSYNEPYMVIDKALIDANGHVVEVIDQAYLHYLLDIAASSYALEDTWPTGDATKKLKWAMLESPGFKEGRAAILSRM